MSYDLISRKTLIEEIKSFRCNLISMRSGKGMLALIADQYRKSILQIIEDQPTAFDKEKVIEELKNKAEDSRKYWSEFDDEDAFGEMNAYKNAIEIVAKGGIE